MQKFFMENVCLKIEKKSKKVLKHFQIDSKKFFCRHQKMLVIQFPYIGIV